MLTQKEIREVDGGWVAVATTPASPWSLGVARSEVREDARHAALVEHEQAIAATVVRKLRPRTMLPSETYEQYLGWHGLLGHGFSYREIVRAGERHKLPPRSLAGRMVMTLALAHLVRDELGLPLVVAAAYRPDRGKPASRHKVNAALDLDLLRGDRSAGGAYLEVAQKIFDAHAHLNVGVGTYHPPLSHWTNRVHIDAGVREEPASWQHHAGRVVTPAAVGRRGA